MACPSCCVRLCGLTPPKHVAMATMRLCEAAKSSMEPQRLLQAQQQALAEDSYQSNRTRVATQVCAHSRKWDSARARAVQLQSAAGMGPQSGPTESSSVQK